MDAVLEGRLRAELDERRKRLASAIVEVGEAPDLVRLLGEVDSALDRMSRTSYGSCEVCKEDVEGETLTAHPTMTWCLCGMSEAQQRALEHDLGLAARVQWALLPPQDLRHGGWEAHFRYLPAGPVSGDYLDVVPGDGGRGPLHFLLGDVSGKGVAAAFLMARLNALFRSLLPTGLEVGGLVDRANQMVNDSTVASQYATLVCGRATGAGELEVCNAGHLAPLLLSGDRVLPLEATGMPVGLFGTSPYETRRVALEPGDTLVLYTDGVTEASNAAGEEYGGERLSDTLRRHRGRSPAALAEACLADLRGFLAGAERGDDLTLLVLRRVGFEA